MPDRDDLADPPGGTPSDGESGISGYDLIGEDTVAGADPSLPEPVRQRVVALAASALSALPGDELPVPLRRVANFAPHRRARLGGPLIALHLSADPLFRQRIGQRAREATGELGEAIAEGTVPAAADPVDVAALAYLCRPAGWADMVAAATEAVRADAESTAIADRIQVAEQRAARAEHERAVARVEADKLRDELARLREEAAALREEVRTLGRSLRETQGREKRASERLAVEEGRAQRAAADNDDDLRRLRARLADAEDLASGARHAAKEARAVDEARLWLLLETIGQAAVGLKRELAIEPATLLPGDHVATHFAERGGAGGAGARALDADDPARLDQLLALPKVHLVVDGYNVTKTGYGELSLEQQRGRLITGIGGIAAQTGAEVTVVFDGAEKLVAAPTPPRGVRVLFSRKGETADELIRRLVRAEPAGRPIVVISTDREVAEGVRRHGAYPLSSDTLLRRLARA
ncbi:NYN domain-containing protein [Luedemannella flava]|uniref:NYN domain-containing protein n=1 Tax=Luedemannella flava TaxID=349316 RepID=A0ABN2LXB2_9ACTN